VSFTRSRWQKSSGFELDGHVNGGGEEWKTASSREREERRVSVMGGVAREEEGEGDCLVQIAKMPLPHFIFVSQADSHSMPLV